MLWAILGASVLLLVGFLLRATMRWLQLLYVPASVIGGVVGLVLVQAAMRTPSEVVAETGTTLADAWRSWPGVLIAVVFAGLLLERPERTLGQSARGALQAANMVWIIVLGQIGLGLLVTWRFILPFVDVPPAFGQLIEAGFAGGHGTATALGTVYREVFDFPDGLDLGLTMATIGLVYSVLSGIVFVNIGVRRGWTRSGRAELRRVSGLEARREPRAVAFGRVRGEVVDPFAFQLLIVALAIGAGMIMQMAFVRAVGLAADLLPRSGWLGHLENVPLFLFTLIGGLLVRKAFERAGIGDLIDAESVKRIVAVAMEFLIVAAMASLRIETVVAYMGPLAVLLLTGFAWTAFCLLWLSPRLLPSSHWFELGILNYGMSTGTTAQGMMLLRIVDPDLESQAAEEYALAAPLSAPFVGGGVVTLALPLLLLRVPLPLVIAVVGIALVVLFFIGRRLNA